MSEQTFSLLFFLFLLAYNAKQYSKVQYSTVRHCLVKISMRKGKKKKRREKDWKVVSLVCQFPLSILFMIDSFDCEVHSDGSF